MKKNMSQNPKKPCAAVLAEDTESSNLGGRYGNYELVPADRETVQEYFEDCLDAVSADEICEAWLLYHVSVRDLLKKVLSFVYEGRGEAYFLLFHDPFGTVRVLGMGGINPVGDMGASAGEIWFAGESLADHRRFLVQYGKTVMRRALRRCPVLFNIAAAWHGRTFRLVRFLGFHVQEDCVRVGADRALFKRFYITEQMLEANKKG